MLQKSPGLLWGARVRSQGYHRLGMAEQGQRWLLLSLPAKKRHLFTVWEKKEVREVVMKCVCVDNSASVKQTVKLDFLSRSTCLLFI